MNIGDFCRFYNSDESLKFIHNMNGLHRGHKHGNPLSTLVSFNFKDDDIFNFKIYSELCRDTFVNEEILTFAPTIEQFKFYLPYWKKLPSSLCFGIKIDRDLKPTQYTHLKLDKELLIKENKFDKFENKLGLNGKNYKSGHVGISYEYFQKNIIEKRYWYFSDIHDIRYIIETFNIKPMFIKCIDHIEYTEFDDGRQKFIIVYDYYSHNKHPDENFLFDMIKAEFGNYIVDVCGFVNSEFNLLPRYIGFYDKDILAVYWSVSGKKFNKNYIKEEIESYNW